VALKLDGADVGRRFAEVADEWEAKLDGEGGFYAFNDLHAALAFAATGRDAAIAKLVARMQQAAEARDANAAMTRDVGLPLVRGVAAYGRGRYDEAVDAIAPVRDIAHRFGGSHAQRDVLSLTLIDAARRAGPLVAREARARRAPGRQARGAVGAAHPRAHRREGDRDALTAQR
jgi:hypothetical protein